jgi:D-alanyl-D-alanine carboxypeptidase/D-alanyl-D-alanine-endopeptidase (penicillin-binding protein 4)
LEKFLSSEKPRFEFLKQTLIGATSGALVLALTIWGIGASGSPSGIPTPQPTDTTTETPTIEPVVKCSIKDETSDARLGNFTGQVIDLDSGTVLYDNGGSKPSITASAIKVVTAAAAMQALGPNFRISTKVVYSSTRPDTVVLVGGGDPTLTRLATGNSVYAGAPRLSDLAQQVKDWAVTAGVPEIRHVVLDASLITGSTWDSSWPTYERTAGYQPLITSLMVDGDRANPKAAKSARSTDPVGRAGREFKKALGELAINADISTGIAASGAVKIAEVKSAKLPTLINYMISASDNTIAEYLARHVAISQGLPSNLQSVQAGYEKALGTMGLDWSGVVIRDGSGESKFDVISPAFFNDLMAKILAGDANLKSVIKGFPVSGKSGTLLGRFTGDNAVARGRVFAKTGSIFHAYALVGYMNAKDESRLGFAIFGAGPTTSVNTRAALDSVATAIYKCGLELSND